MALFARVVHDAFGGAVGDWQQIVAFLSVLSMFLGAIAAIGQTDIKRLMAYSSIAHMGFALMGLAAGTAQGVQAMLIYMAIYVTMNIGTFAFILSMEKDGRRSPRSPRCPPSPAARAKALALLVLMFSLAGVPPLVGFFGKFYGAAGGCRCGARLACRGRGDRLGDRRLLLPAHRLPTCISARSARRSTGPCRCCLMRASWRRRRSWCWGS
jgi:NADH:ubiquinone oxidoreductase subunit 2 (subunit N)